MNIDFSKGNNLVPAIIQHAITENVLMLGYMNKAAYDKTLVDKKVCFYSRSKQRLWTKGETSGNFLHVKEILTDCDNDALLIKVMPEGPVCHKKMQSCFGNTNAKVFLYELEEVIKKRYKNPFQTSYTSQLFNEGINRILQKVGEEAIEVVIEAKDDEKEKLLNETADLLYHLFVLLRAKGVDFIEVEETLAKRHR